MLGGVGLGVCADLKCWVADLKCLKTIRGCWVGVLGRPNMLGSRSKMLKMLGGVGLGVWGRPKMLGRRPKMFKMLGGVGFWEFRTFEFGIFDFGIFDLGFWQLGCRPRISNKVSLNVETEKSPPT